MSKFQFGRRLATAAAAVAAFGGFAQAAQAKDQYIILPKHKYGAFYTPPSPLPYGEPGAIIRAKRMGFTKSQAKPPRGTLGWLIMYHSRSALGQDIAVTGYVLVPKGYNPVQGVANRPIIGYGNEAMGLGDGCAQSLMLQYAQSGEVALYQDMLKRGYAVAASDYEGLGTPATHTFGITLSAAHTTLDAIRAARNLTDPDAGLPKNGPVALLGYSQGGVAVAGAAEQAAEYAPDVKITAAASGGAPTEPIRFSKFNSGHLFSGVNFAASIGYNAAYPELDLPSFLNERGKVAFDSTQNACIESTFTLGFKRSSAYLLPGKNPLTDPRWIKRFRENTVGFKAPQFPVYYFHALADEAIPYFSAKVLRRRWCAGGTAMRFVPLYLLEHVSAGPLWMPQAEKWLDQQLKGNLDKGNCAEISGQKPDPIEIDTF